MTKEEFLEHFHELHFVEDSIVFVDDYSVNLDWISELQAPKGAPDVQFVAIGHIPGRSVRDSFFQMRKTEALEYLHAIADGQ